MIHNSRIRRMAEPILTPGQMERFQQFYPKKLYRAEQNMGLIIAASQLCMVLLLFLREGCVFSPMLSNAYFYLYTALFVITICVLPVHKTLMERKNYSVQTRMRRCYVLALCIWVIGITVLDEMQGLGLGVFCYLIPTMGAISLMRPLESILIFGCQWAVLVTVLCSVGSESDSLFAYIINSLLATILAVFISIRYYRSMQIEFRDRETIETQYKEIQKVNEQLKQMAYTDQLTGLKNRRYLAEKILPRFEEYREQGYWSEILMADIDYFKQYNDSYGHIQGDTCLKQIASAIRDCIRDGSIEAIRYGGEEFLVIRLMKEKDCSSELAAKIQKQIRKAHIPRDDSRGDHVTVSIGVWQGSLRTADNMESLIRFADDALYRAKNEGRDCIKYA